MEGRHGPTRSVKQAEPVGTSTSVPGLPRFLHITRVLPAPFASLTPTNTARERAVSATPER